MTTIAYRDGFLACDSLISMTDNLFYTEKYLITEKSVWGFAGCRGNVLLFIEWLNSGMDRKALPAIAKDDGFSAIQIDRSDLTVSVWFSPQLIAQRVNVNHEAIGSGGSMAMGAMGFGASAQEAVEVASHHDVYTGGPIHVIDVKAGKLLAQETVTADDPPSCILDAMNEVPPEENPC